MKNLSGPLPWTRSCIVCGADNPRGYKLRVRVESGVVKLAYRTRPSDTGYKDLVHGGILATFLDETMAWAAILETGRLCVAARFGLRMKHPVKAGAHIIVEARVQRASKLRVTTAGLVLANDNRILAHGEGTYLPMDDEDGRLLNAEFVTGPDTIDIRNILT